MDNNYFIIGGNYKVELFSVAHQIGVIKKKTHTDHVLRNKYHTKCQAWLLSQKSSSF